MTKTEARQYIIDHCNPYYPQGDTKWDDAMNTAIKTLEEPDMNVIIDTIKNAINASTGNEAYMVGLRNGMRWCWSALTNKEPEYEDISSTQLDWNKMIVVCDWRDDNE